jgi:hypothetical protein
MAERYHRPIPPLTQKQVERFLSRVAKGQANECWLWTRAKFTDGYGAITIKKSTMRASRVAYFIATGIDPGDKLVCHRCDNPPCCNPAHLFLGDDSDNLMDASAKGLLNTVAGDEHYTRRRPDLMELRKGDRHWTHRKPERTSKGEKNGAARFTEQTVRLIRDTYTNGGISQSELARQFGVCSESIRKIILRKTWAHVA